MKIKININDSISFFSKKGDSVLSSALDSCIMLEHSCMTGKCGSCKVRLLSGSVKELRSQDYLSLKEMDDNFILTCCCEASSNIEIDAIDLSAMHGIEIQVLPAKINSIELLSEDIIQVKLRLPPASNFLFLEGQYIDVIGPNAIRRSYSIASIASNKELVLLIKRVEKGEFSAYWFNKAKLNDLLRIEGPKGTFFLRDKSKSLVFLATGTGIAPIISILEELDKDPDFIQAESISLFWGNRVQQDFVWTPNFQRINVNFYPVVSIKNDAWKGKYGYVQDVALEVSKDIQKNNVYACGASEMINSAKVSFIKAGLSEKDFYADAFVQSY